MNAQLILEKYIEDGNDTMTQQKWHV